MDDLRQIDVLFGVVGGLLSALWLVLYGMLKGNTTDTKATAQEVSDERAKTAALVMAEKEKLAALVKMEHDRLASQVREDQDRIRAEFHRLEVGIAREYATTTLVEKMLVPIMETLKHIESMLPNKIDRREFDQHKAETQGKGQ